MLIKEWDQQYYIQEFGDRVHSHLLWASTRLSFGLTFK